MNRSSLLALVAALASLAAAPPTLPLYSGRPLAAWLADLDDPDLLVREEAVEVLGHLGAPGRAAVGKLHKLLAHPNRPLRERAAISLWRLTGDARPAVGVLSASLRETNETSARSILTALADMGADAAPAANAILPFLDDGDPQARSQAARALTRIGRPGLPALFKALEHKEPRLRRNAVGVLVHHLSPLLTKAEVPPLRVRLVDEDRQVRVDAARLLWGMGQHDKAVLTALHQGVQAPDPAMAANVLTTLNAKDKSKALVPLLETVLAGKNTANRIVAARILFEIEKNPRRVLPIYLAAIKGNNRDDWADAFQGLGELEAEAREAVPRLIEILKLRDLNDPWSLQKALIRIGPACVPGVVAILEDTINNSDEQNAQEIAITILGSLGKPAAAAVTPLLASKNHVVRSRAVRVLQAIGPEAKDAVPRIVALLDDPDEVIRDNAANALGGIGHGAKEAVPKLLKLAAGKEQPLGISSLKALAQIGLDAKQAVPLATAALKEKNVYIQAAGLELLAASDRKHEDLTPAIERLLQRQAMRVSTLQVVARLGEDGARVVPAVIGALKDSDSATSRQAVEALAAIGPAAKIATPALLEQLPLRDQVLQQAVVNALRDIDADPKETVPKLAAFARANTRYPANQAVALLGEYGPKATDAYPALLAVLRDPSQQPATRAAAGLALVQIDPGRASKEIRADLYQMIPSTGYEWTAVRALLLLDPDDKMALAAAEAALASADPYGRYSVCQQLAYLGAKAKRFLPAIRAMRKDSQYFVRATAAVATWRITSEKKEAVAILRTVLEDKAQMYGRMTAAHLLGEMGAEAKELLPVLKAMTDRDLQMRWQIDQAIRSIERAVARKAASDKKENIGRITP